MLRPTTGDRIRLADTTLVIEEEKDFITYGEEVKFGGEQGDTRRHGAGQMTRTGKREVYGFRQEVMGKV